MASHYPPVAFEDRTAGYRPASSTDDFEFRSSLQGSPVCTYASPLSVHLLIHMRKYAGMIEYLLAIPRFFDKGANYDGDIAVVSYVCNTTV